MRRIVLCLIVLATLMIGIGLSVALGQESSLESGALGLSKSEIEADFGTVEKPLVVPGHAIYDKTFAYETQAGTLYVSYRDVNGELTAVYVEFAWRGNGVSEQAARDMVAHLIPADASLTELYVAPPTSRGPVALVTYRYESESLGAVPALAPEILVIAQEEWGDPAEVDSTRVMAVSISIPERTQATG
jgi:hypothetical protein